MSPSHSSDDAFSEAARSWNIDQLYLDLAVAKGKGLTRVEKQYLRGLLCYCSPNEIAEQLHVAGDTVRNYLSKGLYRYIEELLIQQDSETIRVKDWSRVPQLLEKAGYRLSFDPEPTLLFDDHPPSSTAAAIAPSDATPALGTPAGRSETSQQTVHDLPDVPVFYGRDTELATLKTWILEDHCRLIALLGMGGIGKTTLAAKLANDIKDQFEVVVWRSLRSGMGIDRFLAEVLGILTPAVPIPDEFEEQLLQLIHALEQHRCLLVLEDVQLLLQSGQLVGQYEPDYEGYGELFRRIAETPGQSCVLLTSWEKTREVSTFEGEGRPVRSLKLRGLDDRARALLEEKKLGNPELWDELILCYRGNPLALKIVATTIHDLFGGSVADFLSQSTLFLGDFSYLLHQQFSRLSPLEQKVMVWLATTGEPATLLELRQGIQSTVALSEVLKVLESLGRRSLMERVKHDNAILFTLQPMVLKYVKRHHSKP